MPNIICVDVPDYVVRNSTDTLPKGMSRILTRFTKVALRPSTIQEHWGCGLLHFGTSWLDTD